MDPRDCSVIDRHFPRLQQCLEPSKLLRHLQNVGIIDEDDVESIREEKTKSSRENQVAVFVDIMKRREHGFRHFLQALLKSKVQDFLARELLEDDVYDEEEISSILAELENDLDETQSLKLSLIEEQKRHKNTKMELEDIRRSSMIFSDSSSSGLFADYDSAPSDENEIIDYSPREEIENGSSRDEGNSSLLDQMQGGIQTSEPLLKRNDDLEWEHEDGWRKFGSVDNIDALSSRKTKRGSLEKLWKSASLGRLNVNVRDKHGNQGHRFGSDAKWSSEESLKQNKSNGSLNRRRRDGQQFVSLEDKVALLEQKLQDEQRKRQISENEVARLQVEKENLFEELEDTRDQMRLSHLNLYCEDDDYEEELYFDQEDDGDDFTEPPNVNDNTATVEGKTRFSPTDIDQTAACCSSPVLNKLLSQTERMRTTRLTGSWRKVNAQFYELDEYDNEIKVELDPSNIADTLRRLKTYTNCLYNDILCERDELQYLKKRASRLENH
ncbi:uncharacterized protein LOC144653865 [Oculina patagonica]